MSEVKQTKDYCMRGTSVDGSVKLWIANTTELCEEARKNHDAWSVAAAALGRLLTAGAFFGLGLKGEDTITLRVDGDGPLGSLVVVGNAQGQVRGYVSNPHVDIPRKEDGKLDVGTAVGAGTLSVIKDMGLGEPYCGNVPLVSGEIGDDIARYLLDSEQVASAVGLGVLVNPDGSIQAAGGFLVQLLPGADDKVISQLELNIANLIPVSQMIENGLTAEEMANEVMLGIPWQELERAALTYQCNCSREKISAALMSLGHHEIKAMIEDTGEAEIVCRFCGKKHFFDKTALEGILEEIDAKRFQEFAKSLSNQVELNTQQTTDVEVEHRAGE